MEVARITPTKRRPPPPPSTFRADLLASLREGVVRDSVVTWPSTRWAADPVGFARDVLGVTLWKKQREIVEAIRDHRNTTIRSGHKCGKSLALAVAALWFFATFVDARVFVTAVKSAQVDRVIYREIKRLYRQAKGRGYDLGAVVNDTARSGIQHEDGRQIWGATARDPDALSGLSGANILVLADEASGIADRFFETLGTALAGSGGVVRKAYISNPTRTTGEFFKSHTSSKGVFHCIHISSEDTPNARGEPTIPGLAGPEWIAEKRIEWGEDSPTFAVRVLGNFVHDLDGKIVSLNQIAAAQDAYDDAPDEGRLQLGIDPAGDGIAGDESAFTVRRGMRMPRTVAFRGLSEDAIVNTALALLDEFRREREAVPWIVVDVEGGIGTRVYAKLRAHLETHRGAFVLVGVRSGKKMWGSPSYELVRDALWGGLAEYLKAGGAITEDLKLAEELNAPVFTADANRRYRATPKKELRKILGRSPDRADSACLAAWKWDFNEAVDVDVDEPAVSEVRLAAPAFERDIDDTYSRHDAGHVFNPYGGAG